MKQLQSLFVVLFAFAFTMLNAQTKRYEIKSGMVEYKIIHSGNMMGVKMEGGGTASTAFKEWGAVELHTEESETITMGMKEHDKQMTKIDNGKVYTVNFEKKVIYEYDMQEVMQSEDKDLVMAGKEMLESMGGKKIGDEEFMGYDCEIWELMTVKIWMHKGVMLKSEVDMMGIKNTIVATKVAFEIDVPDEAFDLPKYPVQKGVGQEEMMPEMPEMTPEQMQQMQEMMKSFTRK
jgi:hypothetical protein